mmetsp:Transcript_78083/g.208768  ORF Transcript_78083/g.208768 Transcript_78083/m.208768 type:complete len:218 (-) Transcript_78083:296-949(-)
MCWSSTLNFWSSSSYLACSWSRSVVISESSPCISLYLLFSTFDSSFSRSTSQFICLFSNFMRNNSFDNSSFCLVSSSTLARSFSFSLPSVLLMPLQAFIAWVTLCHSSTCSHFMVSTSSPSWPCTAKAVTGMLSMMPCKLSAMAVSLSRRSSIIPRISRMHVRRAAWTSCFSLLFVASLPINSVNCWRVQTSFRSRSLARRAQPVRVASRSIPRWLS